MSNTELKIGRLDESSGKGKKYVASMALPFTQRKGFVFAVLDVRGPKNAGTLVHKLIEDELATLAENIEDDESLQHVFEALLANLNTVIEEESAKPYWSLSASNFNGLIGMAADDQMYLTGAGDMVGVFLHQKDKTRYQIFNLFRGIQTEKAGPSWEKIFSVVLDGDLHPGDIFVAATNELAQEVPKDELMGIVTTLQPSGATVKLRQYFPLKTEFAAVVMKAETNKKGVGAERTQAAASMDNLDQVTTKTQRVLEDQKPDITKLSYALNLLTGLAKVLFAALLIALHLIWGLLKYVGVLVYKLVRTDRAETLKLTKSHTDKMVDTALGRFNRLPKSSKYILLAILALVFVFVVSVLFISRGKAIEREQQAYQMSVQAIEEKRDSAMASVIYQDENQARTLLFDALSMIDEITPRDEEQQAELDTLRGEINAALDDLRHISQVEEPTVLSDLRGVEADANATNIAMTNNGLFVFADNQSVYQLDSENKTLNLAEDATSDIAGTALASGWDDTNNLIFFVDDRPGFSMFDPDQNILTDMTATLIGSVPDIEVYARRIYALSPETEQILRYDRVGYSFGSGSPWIDNKKTDLTDAVSLTIDGDVYILKADGTFVKFENNSEVTWNMDLIDPALSGANARIWSTDTSEFLYVLDPDQSRVLVIRKTSGALIVQYHSDNFEDLKDFIVDEDSGQIYLLAGTQILSIEAIHLN